MIFFIKKNIIFTLKILPFISSVAVQIIEMRVCKKNKKNTNGLARGGLASGVGTCGPAPAVLGTRYCTHHGSPGGCAGDGVWVWHSRRGEAAVDLFSKTPREFFLDCCRRCACCLACCCARACIGPRCSGPGPGVP
jgi:hypothetical protein